VSHLILIFMLVRLPSAHPGASAATHSPSNPETPPMGYSPFSDEDIDAAYNSFFTISAFYR
jgi:hypothetical protein